MAVQPARGRLFSFKEALEYLGMPAPRLRRLVARKKIPVIRDGRLGFYERDLEDWIIEHRTPATGPDPLTLPSARVSLQETSGIDDLLKDIKRRGGSPFDNSTHGDARSATR